MSSFWNCSKRQITAEIIKKIWLGDAINQAFSYSSARAVPLLCDSLRCTSKIPLKVMIIYSIVMKSGILLKWKLTFCVLPDSLLYYLKRGGHF